MSSISQNALRKKQVDIVKDEEINEPLLQEDRDGMEAVKELNLVHSNSKKKEKIRRKDDKETDVEEKERKKRKKMEEEEKEMKKHENFLFGGLYSPAEFGKEEEEAGNAFKDGPALFFTDCSANEVDTYYEEAEYEDQNGGIEARKPAWVDDEEETILINIAKRNSLRKLRKEEDETSILGLDYESRSRAQFVKLNPGTEWAQLGSQGRNDSESDEEIGALADDAYGDNGGNGSILRNNEDLVVKSSVRLLPGLLEYSRLVDANAVDPINAPMNSVQFHRNGQLLLAAGLNRKLKFFQIDGKRNSVVQSIDLEDCPIRKASFLPDGSQVIASGRRKFFYSVDLEKGRWDRIGPLVGREEKSLESFEVSPDSRTIAFLGNEGYILLVSCKTKELIGTLKMNGTARSVAFADDGRQLVSSGGDGHIYHWDLRTRTCFHKAVDEGCIMGSALGTSPNGSLLAAGSSSGFVNMYNREEFLGGKRKPLKAIENLTSKVDFVKFNHDAQILAICSSLQKNSLKLVHIPSFSVFSNWPPAKRALHHPRCLDFSPGGGFMAMGNAAGKVFLYKLHHYQHA